LSPRATFLIGASGAGKSAVARALARTSAEVSYLHFDEIIAEMGFWAAGEAEAWQRRATHEWCRRIAQLGQHHAGSARSPARHVLLDGQTRHEFVAEACAAAAISEWQVVLVHCQREERETRLNARGEPQLASPEMQQWADWLWRDAQARAIPVLDTTQRSIESARAQLAALLGLAAA
jgi:hypothetical protein